jgi:hypothetical protein
MFHVKRAPRRDLARDLAMENRQGHGARQGRQERSGASPFGDPTESCEVTRP